MATIKETIIAADYPAAVKLIIERRTTFAVPEEEIDKQFDVTKHAVFDPIVRKMKNIRRSKMDENGQPVFIGDGASRKPAFETILQEVTRVGLAIQEGIVDNRVGFMCGNPVRIDLSNYDGESKVKKMVELIWEANKMDYKNIEVAKTLMSECEVAELWYLVEDKENFWQKKSGLIGGNIAAKYILKSQILKRSNGELMYPEFDSFGDMISFSYKFKIKIDGKDIERITYMDAEKIIQLENVGGWKEIAVNGNVDNAFKKIPVIYYKQTKPEWANVQSLIDQYEKRLSNLGDENDYFGSPMMFLKGTITGFAAKGEAGKLLQGDKDSDASVLSWDNAPESTKVEFEKLEKNLYALSHTADISFDNLKGQLGNISGIALKLLFIDAHMAVKVKERIYGEGLQRRLNLLKSAIGSILSVSLLKESDEISLTPVITPYLPQNTKEDVETIATAKQMGIISLETALELNPLVSNPEAELDKIRQDEATANAGSITL